MDDLSKSLPNATFKFGDAYDAFQSLIDRPYLYGAYYASWNSLGKSLSIRIVTVLIDAGFNNSHAPCCTLGRIRPTLTCTPLSTLCKDRSEHVFWDEYHPTDQANELIANEIFKKLDMKPINDTTNP